MGFSLEQLQGLLGGTTDIGALLASSGQSNPAMEAVLGALAQQRSAAASNAATDDASEPARGDIAEAPVRIAALEGRFEQLRDIARRMDHELRVLRRRNAQLAAALGACPHCWGEDPECTTCAGEGRPGSAPPHRGHFRHYVAAARGRPAPALHSFPRAVAGFSGGSQD